MLVENLFKRKYRTPAEKAHCIREAKRHERRTAYEKSRIERITEKMNAREKELKPVSLTIEHEENHNPEKHRYSFIETFYVVEVPIVRGARKRMRERNLRQAARGTLAPRLQVKYAELLNA